MGTGVVKLIPYDLQVLQAALIEWGRQNPYGQIHELTFQDGIPVIAEVWNKEGTGTEMVLFEKIARQVGLIK